MVKMRLIKNSEKIHKNYVLINWFLILKQILGF